MYRLSWKTLVVESTNFEYLLSLVGQDTDYEIEHYVPGVGWVQ